MRNPLARARSRTPRTRRASITQGGRRRLDTMRTATGRAARRGAMLLAAAATLAGVLMWQTGGSDVLQLVKVGIIVALVAIIAIGVLAWRDGYGRGLLQGMGAEVKRRRNRQAASVRRAKGVKPRSQARRKPVAGRKSQQSRTGAIPARPAAKTAPRRTPTQAYPLNETRRAAPGMSWIGGKR